MTTPEPETQENRPEAQIILPALDYLHEIFATCDFLSDEECIACALAAD